MCFFYVYGGDGLDWFLVGCNLLVPLVLILGGRLMWKRCPKRINGVYGYRTRRSMRNLDTWRFAHDYCGRLWWKWGWWLLVFSLLVQFLGWQVSQRTEAILRVGLCGFQCGVVFFSISRVERALKRAFTENGERK